LALALPCVGKAPRRPVLPVKAADSPQLAATGKQGLEHYNNARYRQAAVFFEQGYQQARQEGQTGTAIRYLNNLAGARLQVFDHAGAMSAYLESRRFAEQASLTDTVPLINANIALLYGLMGEHAKSAEIAETALKALPPASQRFRSTILQILGDSLTLDGRMERGAALLLEAAEEADRWKEPSQTASALDHLGYWYLDRGQLSEADRYLSEAFRIRRLLVPTETYLCYPKLGKLRLEQKRYPEALALLNQSLESRRSDPGKFPLHRVHGDRARARLAVGDRAGARADFIEALDMVRRQRVDILPVSSMQASWEAAAHDLRSAFIQFTAEEALAKSDRTLALEALATAEESRHASLRAATGPGQKVALPPAYWDRLALLQRAHADVLNNRPGAAETAKRLEIELADLEAQAGLDAAIALPRSAPIPALEASLARLSPDEALFSFHLGEPYSYAWHITRDRIQIRRLPSKKDLTGRIQTLRGALLSDKPSGMDYSQIFGEISPDVATKRYWTVVLDDRLFELPLAALRVPGTTGTATEDSVYLVEKHTLRLAPSVFLSTPTTSTGASSALFVGVGDPIYNPADPRQDRTAPAGQPSFTLPRLIGSGAEIDRCAKSWGGERVTLTGGQANRATVTEMVARRPAVLHFATHFVTLPDTPTTALIALRQPELLGAEQISAFRAAPELVVLSGCASGAGQTIPGAGLMGLTRSWLLAGANGVAASLWPTTDDRGELFSSFYRHYSTGPHAGEAGSRAAADALRQAQIEMLQSTDWRRVPRHWAGFFLISKGS
jgi:hypothetical protein